MRRLLAPGQVATGLVSRRRVLGGGACAAAVASLPRSGWALAGASRRFLFVHVEGGWDPCVVLAPLFDHPEVHTEGDADVGTVGGLVFADSPHRPKVREFFERYADRCCVVNGIDLETVSHDRGVQMVLTGAALQADDWPTLLAVHAPPTVVAPHLVVSGPSLTLVHPEAVVRLGDDGQLDLLLQGEGLGGASLGPVRHLLEDWLQARGSLGAALPDDVALLARWGDAQGRNLALQARRDSLSLTPADQGQYGEACDATFMTTAVTAVQAFAQGLSRCAIVADRGVCDMRWDSHDRFADQGLHHEKLFTGLLQLMDALTSTQDPDTGGPLAESTTVVVFSELGRHPKLNDLGGKHHWPVTSALLIGGVTGGRVVGGFDDQVLSVRVDPGSAEASDAGVRLTGAVLGATLLALGDVDPAQYTDAPALTGIVA